MQNIDGSELQIPELIPDTGTLPVPGIYPYDTRSVHSNDLASRKLQNRSTEMGLVVVEL